MAKETKTVTLRIPQKLVSEVLDPNNLNQSVVECLERIQVIRLASMAELKGVFSPDEWKFFADSLNGTMVDGLFRCNVQALIAHCEDAIAYEINRFNISLPDLIEKIKSLKGANVEALYTRVENFWNNPEVLDEWAKF